VNATSSSTSSRRTDSQLADDTSPAGEARSREFGRPGLVQVAELRTRRRPRRLHGLLVEPDRVSYPDGERTFEIDVETDDPERAGRILAEESSRRDVAWHSHSETKRPSSARS